MKRFEYQYVFYSHVIKENITSIKCFLDSFKEATGRISEVKNLMGYSYTKFNPEDYSFETKIANEFLYLKKTGKKFRTPDWRIKIYLYLLIRIFRVKNRRGISLLILMVMSSISCKSPGDRYLKCDCIKSHTQLMMTPMTVGKVHVMRMMPVVKCDLKKCDSVYLDNNLKEIIIKP